MESQEGWLHGCLVRKSPSPDNGSGGRQSLRKGKEGGCLLRKTDQLRRSRQACRRVKLSPREGIGPIKRRISGECAGPGSFQAWWELISGRSEGLVPGPVGTTVGRRSPGPGRIAALGQGAGTTGGLPRPSGRRMSLGSSPWRR
jgi:hypothetical protein